MKKITVYNSFHNTSATIPVNGDGKVTVKDVNKAAKKLCGMKDCCCGGVPTNGYCVVDEHGKKYEIV